jgi:hypothetical protein
MNRMFLFGRNVSLNHIDISFNDCPKGLGTIWNVMKIDNGLLVKRITDTDEQDGVCQFDNADEFVKVLKEFYDVYNRPECAPDGLEEFIYELKNL